MSVSRWNPIEAQPRGLKPRMTGKDQIVLIGSTRSCRPQCAQRASLFLKLFQGESALRQGCAIIGIHLERTIKTFERGTPISKLGERPAFVSPKHSISVEAFSSNKSDSPLVLRQAMQPRIGAAKGFCWRVFSGLG
jgi:hypothetical protein